MSENPSFLLIVPAQNPRTYAVLLPAGCLHHFLDARSLGLAEASEHALLLGDPLAGCFFSLDRRFGSGELRGLRASGLRC